MGIGNPGNWWRFAIPLALGLFLGLGFLFAVWKFARALAVLALSITVASAFAPAVDWLSRRMRRVLAVSLIYLALVGILTLVGWLVAPQLTAEVNRIVDRGPELYAALQAHLQNWLKVLPPSAMPRLGQMVGSWMGALASLPIRAASSFLTVFLMLFFSFYWLIALPQIDRFIGSLFPPEERPRVDEIRERMFRSMGGYLRGVTLNAIATGGLVWLALELLGVHYALALGTLSAMGEFVPYVGPIVASVPGILAAFLQSPVLAVPTALAYLGVAQIEAHVLTPNIMHSQADIPQTLVIIALFAGGLVGGLLGAVAAIPIAAACKVLVETVAAPAVRRWTSEALRER